MYFFYNSIVVLASKIVSLVALFQPKIKLFVEGRKNTWLILEKAIQKNEQYVWFHAASLGEFEQGVPVIQAYKKQFPTQKIILTFFSPSGYEIRKNTPLADVVCYLPLDTKTNVQRFLKLVQPQKVFFIKYEFWPNYLKALQQKEIPVYLISGIFSEKQLFFKWHGGFYRNCLQAFTHFFVQDENSKQLLQAIQIQNVTVSGDTRFDRVSEILKADNTLDYVEQFINNQLCVVVGSSWLHDETILVDYINNSEANVKWIIAPHNIKMDQIQNLKQRLTKSVVLFSEKEQSNLSDYAVFIVDTIGILTKIYSYASVAYVGGGFGSGIHNVLEPATFGVPIVIGPKYARFKEAVDLVAVGGCVSVTNKQEFKTVFDELLQNKDFRTTKGAIAKQFVQGHTGAVTQIMKGIN